MSTNYSRGTAAKLSILVTSAAVLALLSGCPAQEGPHPPPHLERTSTPTNFAAPEAAAQPASQLAPQANKERTVGK